VDVWSADCRKQIRIEKSEQNFESDSEIAKQVEIEQAATEEAEAEEHREKIKGKTLHHRK